MTVLQVILAVCAFAIALYLINRYVQPPLFRNILVGIVVVLAVVLLLRGFGLMDLLNTPVTGVGRRHL